LTDPRLAALWLHALQRLADRAAHELNNALNGVVVNLEVVRARTRPGEDPGRVVPFAEAAVEQAEGATALAGALLALVRTPRPGAPVDAAVVARQVETLLAPAVAHRGVRVWLEASDPAPVTGDPSPPPLAVRSAIALALLDAAEAAESAARSASPSVSPAELGGSNPADESLRRLRCTVSSVSGVIVRIEPPGAPSSLPEPAIALLREAGVDVVRDAEAVTITFRDPTRELP
jgi:hypothetical protein